MEYQPVLVLFDQVDVFSHAVVVVCVGVFDVFVAGRRSSLKMHFGMIADAGGAEAHEALC